MIKGGPENNDNFYFDNKILICDELCRLIKYPKNS